VNRLNIRRPIRVLKPTSWMAILALAVVALSGCGTGQISQTAAQEPAVNGNRLTLNNVALRDIRIQAAQTGDFLQPGKTVDLVLVAINNSPDVNDRLTGITSEIGNVTVSGDAKLPAGKSLIIGTPDGQVVAPGPAEGNGAAKATVNLTKPITNGLTYQFTFKFEKAGEGSVQVPISAGMPQMHEGSGHP
jgi:copper(I)-binding protein